MSLLKKIGFLLVDEYKRQSILLIFMMVIGTFLEVAGIGLIIPVLGFLANEDAVIKSPIIQSILPNNFELYEVNFLLWGMITLIIVYVIKTVYLTYLSWRISKTVYGLEEKLSKKLYQKYLKQPFPFHLEKNSGKLIQNVTGEVNQLASIIMGGLNLIAEIFVVIGVVALLLIIEPIGTILSIAMLMFFSLLYYFFVKDHLLRWGLLRQAAEGNRIKELQQGFGGIKDVKLFGCEDQLVDTFSEHNTMFTKMNMLQNFFNIIPRFFIELIAVLLLAILFIILSNGDSSSAADLIPVIGLFAVAAFRLMPSANRILVSTQTLRYATPVINTIYSELNIEEDLLDKNKPKLLSFLDNIKFENVNFSYSNNENQALIDVNLNISKGSCIGIIGASGSGKSTLINLLLGLLKPINGKIVIDGQNLHENTRGWQDQIGYVPQDIFLLDDTLRNNIAFGVDFSRIDSDKVMKAIELSQLSEYIENLPQGLDTIVGERGVKISGGQRQRIGIARALYNDPDVLVLDEATSALDGATEEGLMSAVDALQGLKTIIIVAHRLSTIENCEYVYTLAKGKIVSESSNFGEIA